MKEIGSVVGFTFTVGFFSLILLGGAYEVRVWWEDRKALKRAAIFEMQHLATQVEIVKPGLRAVEHPDEWAVEIERAREWDEWATTLEEIRALRHFYRGQWEQTTV